MFFINDSRALRDRVGRGKKIKEIKEEERSG
jgi:hypothetical protein